MSGDTKASSGESLRDTVDRCPVCLGGVWAVDQVGPLDAIGNAGIDDTLQQLRWELKQQCDNGYSIELRIAQLNAVLGFLEELKEARAQHGIVAEAHFNQDGAIS